MATSNYEFTDSNKDLVQVEKGRTDKGETCFELTPVEADSISADAQGCRVLSQFLSNLADELEGEGDG